jgi:hypothetical protein
MSREQANLFFQVVAQRYERGSMILTSNLTLGSWDTAFANDGVLTVGMLDRLLRHWIIVSIHVLWKCPSSGKSGGQIVPCGAEADEVAITRSFTMQLKRRGVELRLILGDHKRSAATVDLPLLKAVARAYR